MGALFVRDFQPVSALNTVIEDGFMQAISDNAGIFLFLVLLGAHFVNHTAFAAEHASWLDTEVVDQNIATYTGCIVQNEKFQKRADAKLEK